METKKEESQALFGFVKILSFGLKQFRLYSAEHPITRQALDSLTAEIEKFFQSKGKISLGSMRGVLVIDGKMVTEKDPSAKDLAGELERLHIESLIFEKGIEKFEVLSFLTLMTTRTKLLEQQGGFKKGFEAKGFKHIKLSSGKYELVQDGQQVVSGKAGEGTSGTDSGPGPSGPQARIGIADFLHKLREEGIAQNTTSSFTQTGFEIDAEKVVVQLEENPEEVAQMALANAEDPARLESVIRKMVQFLTEGLISFLIDQGRDITKALEKLAKELEKALSRSGSGHEFDELQKKIPGIFQEAADKIRVQMMVRTYKNNPEDQKGLQKIADKLFKDKEVRERLQGDLSEAGLPQGKMGTVFQKIEDKEIKKKQRVTIDAEELEELRRKAEHFDPKVQKSAEWLVGKLEKEKRKILAEKQRVESVIHHLAEGLVVIDKDGKVVLMNPAAERLLGMRQSQKVGRPVTDDIKEGQLLALAQDKRSEANVEVSKKVEILSLDDETKKVLQASTAIIENQEGHTVGMVSVLSDVTRQKELEELKDKFVANVSHELRTPLVAIQKSLSLILSKEAGGLNPDQERFLSIAYRNIDRLSRLINDILHISKIESGRMVLRPGQVSLKDLVTLVTSTVQTWAAGKKIKFETHFSDESAHIEADGDRITQVLTNLVGNAIKFTPEGGTISIDVKTGIREADSGEEFVEIAVKDNGIGISKEDMLKVFEKFMQVPSEQPANVSGSGLGLTIAKEIVELHSGRIWVESELGKGSCFIFRVPVHFRMLGLRKQSAA